MLFEHPWRLMKSLKNHLSYVYFQPWARLGNLGEINRDAGDVRGAYRSVGDAYAGRMGRNDAK